MKLNAFMPLRDAATPAAPDPEKIREASRGFEGLFLAQLFKVMKQSVAMGKKETLFRSDAMSDFAELEFTRVLAERRPMGLADVISRSMAGASPSGEKTSSKAGLPLKAAVKASIPLKRASVPLKVAPAPLAAKTEAPIDLATPPLSTARAPLAKAPVPRAFQDADIEPIIESAARRHDLHPALLRAVIACESAGDPKATSPKGAKGLMQLVDSTAQMMGVRNVWNPRENVEGGARYLRTLLDRFDQRVDWALAAYNAGPTAVERHQGIPPYDETQQYVKRVLQHFQRLGAEPEDGS
jgi:soluble lytic murein transglycosylase-like protein